MNGRVKYQPVSVNCFLQLKRFDSDIQCLTSTNDCAPQVEFLGWEISLPNSLETNYDEELFGDYLIVCGNRQYAVPHNMPGTVFLLVTLLQKELNEGGLTKAEGEFVTDHFLC